MKDFSFKEVIDDFNDCFDELESSYSEKKSYNWKTKVGDFTSYNEEHIVTSDYFIFMVKYMMLYLKKSHLLGEFLLRCSANATLDCLWDSFRKKLETDNATVLLDLFNVWPAAFNNVIYTIGCNELCQAMSILESINNETFDYYYGWIVDLLRFYSPYDDFAMSLIQNDNSSIAYYCPIYRENILYLQNAWNLPCKFLMANAVDEDCGLFADGNVISIILYIILDSTGYYNSINALSDYSLPIDNDKLTTNMRVTWDDEFDKLKQSHLLQNYNTIVTSIDETQHAISDFLEDTINPQTGKYLLEVSKDYIEEHPDEIAEYIEDGLLDTAFVTPYSVWLLFDRANERDKMRIIDGRSLNNCRLDDGSWDTDSAEEELENLQQELSEESSTKHILFVSKEDLAKNEYSLDPSRYYSPVINVLFDLIKDFLPRDSEPCKKTAVINTVLYALILRFYELYLEEQGAQNARKTQPFRLLSKHLENDSSYDQIVHYLSHKQYVLKNSYAVSIELLIYYYYVIKQVRTPWDRDELYAFIGKICDIRESDKIYVPYVGIGSWLLGDICSEMMADEPDEITWALGKIRMKVMSDNNAPGYLLQDPTQRLGNPSDQKYNIIASMPPLHDSSFNEQPVGLISAWMNSLTENGKVALVLPAEYIQSNDYYAFRNTILQNHWLEKVIKLPKQIFDEPDMEMCLFILSTKSNGIITFYDLSDCTKEDKGNISFDKEKAIRLVDSPTPTMSYTLIYKEFADSQFTLNFQQPLIVPDGFVATKLQAILTPLKGVETSADKGPLLQSSLMAKNIADCRKKSGDFPIADLTKSCLEYNQDAMFICANRFNMRPTYCYTPVFFKQQNTPILYAFTFDTNKLSPEYLYYALNESFVKNQIKHWPLSNIGSMTADDFLSLSILLPKDKQTQMEIVGEVTRELYETHKAESDKRINASEKEREEEFKSWKHAMGKPVAGIQAACDLLMDYFEKEGTIDTIINQRRSSTLGEKLSVIKESAKLMETLMKNGANFLDTSKYPLLSASIDDVYGRIIRKKLLESDTFSTAYADIKLPRVNISINWNLFEILINDIRSNAEKHAFHKADVLNEVVVDVNVDESWFTLSISNNGERFPENVDTAQFTKRHWSAGDSRGSGIGGNDIQKIMRHFGGTFELITDYSPLFPTCYVLKFPLE